MQGLRAGESQIHSWKQGSIWKACVRYYFQGTYIYFMSIYFTMCHKQQHTLRWYKHCEEGVRLLAGDHLNVPITHRAPLHPATNTEHLTGTSVYKIST